MQFAGHPNRSIPMRLLITAGNTQTPIDDVRVITNVFSGRTGTQIAMEARARGHFVSLLTSHPELVANSQLSSSPTLPILNVHAYRTFDDLHQLLERQIRQQPWDAVIHCAAVSDYQLAGTYAPLPNQSFDAVQRAWRARGESDLSQADSAQFLDVTAGKIKSSHSELWLRLIPTPKLIDLMRDSWGFQGVLVKFKLEVGPTDDELIQIAEASRRFSHADFIVANTYAGMRDYAYLGPIAGTYQRVERSELATKLLDQVERLFHSPLSPLPPHLLPDLQSPIAPCDDKDVVG